jgi:hypothetical protein
LYCTGHGTSCLELTGRTKRPARITQELSSKEDNIGLLRTNDLVRLDRSVNQPNRTHRHAWFPPNSFRKLSLVARPNRSHRFREIATGRHIDQVCLTAAEFVGELNGLSNRPTQVSILLLVI